MGLLLCAAALGLGTAVWRQDWRLAGAAVDDAAAVRAPEPPGAAPLVTAAAGDAPAVAVAAASTAAPGTDAAAVMARIPPEGLEVCGFGRLTVGLLQSWLADMVGARAWMQAREAELERRVNAGLAQIAARLAAGGERQQVAARWLMGDAEGAAALAERSSDAMVYQMALKACGPAARASAPSCARLSVQRWAALDPSDARPWLGLLAQAHARGDRAAVDAALAEAAARPHLSRGGNLLEAQVAPLADLVTDTADRVNGLLKVIGMDSAVWEVGYLALSRACSGDELQRPQRRQHCRAVASQVLAAASDLLEASLAQTLAERAGVPPAQQAYDAATLKAAQSALQDRAFGDIGLDCASMTRISNVSVQRAAQGELAMALALLPAASASRPGAAAAP
ncbi:MAG: hypothetical protein GXC94_16135 [Comamonadaceae bacterium]|nr:hypothetical protein [Comamonadaceae bacterium]